MLFITGNIENIFFAVLLIVSSLNVIFTTTENLFDIYTFTIGTPLITQFKENGIYRDSYFLSKLCLITLAMIVINMAIFDLNPTFLYILYKTLVYIAIAATLCTSAILTKRQYAMIYVQKHY